MILSRIKLTNFIGMYIAQQCETFEISMDNQYPMTLIRGSNGFGKAQPVTTLIPTPDGCKPMGELQIGDTVFTQDGSPTTVTGIFDQGIKDVYQLTFVDGRSTMCCKEHLWKLIDRKGNMMIKELQDIMSIYLDKDGQPQYCIPRNGLVQFVEQPTPIDPWAMGFYVRYGLLNEEYLTIGFSDHLVPGGQWTTANYLDRFAAAIHTSSYAIMKRGNYYQRFVQFNIKTHEFLKDLPELLSEIPTIPACYLYNTESVRQSFLDGLMVSAFNDSPMYGVPSPTILAQATSMARSLGKDLSFVVSPQSTLQLVSLAYDGLFLTDIQHRGQMQCRCIMVDHPSHLYLTDEYLVTHNTVLLSAMSSPFAYDGGIDNRSSTDIIRPGYTGEKEMEYRDGSDVFLIKHIYKPTQTGHSVKSTISKNGVELNPNGNVSSFTEIIQSVFGITEKDLMLLRLGTNATSFISLSSMERKRYLSRIIGDIDIYMQLFNMIQSDIRVNKGILSNYTEEMAKLHIDDIEQLKIETSSRKRKLDKILLQIGEHQQEIQQLSSSSVDPNQLSRERSMLQEKISFVATISDDVKRTSIDTLKSERHRKETERDQTQTKVNQIKSSIDANNRAIQYAKIDIEKLSVDDSLGDKIHQLEQELVPLAEQYKGFKYQIPSKTFEQICQELLIIRTRFQMVINYEPSIVSEAIRIYTEQQDIDQWVDKNLSKVLDPSAKLEMAQHLKLLTQEGYHVPDCTDVNCVYRKMGEMIASSENADAITAETIKSVKTVYGLLATNLSHLQRRMQDVILPKQLTDILQESAIINQLKEGQIFTMDLFDSYRSAIYGYESYQQKQVQLSSYRDQERAKQDMANLRSTKLQQITGWENDNQSLYTQLSTQSAILSELNDQIAQLDVQIGKRVEYDAIKDLVPSYTKRIDEISQQIISYTALSSKLSSLKDQIELLNDQVQEIRSLTEQDETRIALYTKYQEDIIKINRLVVELGKILRNVSAKDKGIPILYMRTFFDKIRIKCNELLDISFDGSLKIGEFDPSSQVFDISYIRNGSRIKDVRFASQGEQPVINIAISFAMSSLLSNKRYNILCCDELDATLDYAKKAKYPELLERQIATMGIEQCFVISHSEVFDTIPTNLIDMEEGLPPIQDANPYPISKQ